MTVESMISNNSEVIMEVSEVSCRLCLVTTTPLTAIDVFVELHREAPLHFIIGQLFSFAIMPTDVSKTICVQCAKLSKEFYDFAETVQNSQIMFPQPQIKAEPLSDVEVDNDFHLSVLKIEVNQPKPKRRKGRPKRVRSESDELQSPRKRRVYSKSDELQPILKERTRNAHLKKENPSRETARSLAKNKLLAETFQFESCPTANDRLVDEALSRDNPFDNFPVQIFKDGSFAVTKTTLEKLLCNFYNTECYICKDGEKYNSLEDMFNHYKRKHETIGYVTCCNLKLEKLFEISNHLVKHLQPSAFRCPECEVDLDNLNLVRTHLKNHASSSKMPFNCNQCTKRFNEFRKLLLHKVTHLKNQTLHKCDTCEKSMLTADFHSMHMCIVHGRNVKFVCPECDEEFTEESALQEHQITHPEDSKYKCFTCKFKTNYKEKLVLHLKHHRSEVIKCKVCKEYKATSRQDLNDHIESEHNYLLHLQCDYCEKRFLWKCDLDQHLASHKVKTLECLFCPVKFVNDRNRRLHMNRYHTDNP